MNYNKSLILLGTALLWTTFANAQGSVDFRDDAPRKKPDLFQVSTLDALSLGLYEGIYSIADLRQRGDFGLGTFEGIDGEMTVLDDRFYHFRSDGSLTEEPGHSKVPFAAVTRFRPQIRFDANGLSLEQLSEQIDRYIPSENFFYAI